jgi:hypothetical protein
MQALWEKKEALSLAKQQYKRQRIAECTSYTQEHVSAIPKFEAPMAKKLLLQFPGIIDCTLFTIIRGWHLIGEDF